MNDDPTYGLPWKPAQVHEAIDRLGDNRLTAAILVHEWLGRGGEPEELIAALQRQVAPNRAQIGELHEMVDGFTEQLEKRHARAERAERRRAEAESRDLARAVSINLDETTFDPRGFFVYLLWGDDTETPLYVGQSINVLGRLGQHMNSPDRRHKVRRVQVMRCRNRADMCKTEDRLIAHYQPPFNTRGILFDAPRKPHAIAGTA